MIIRFMNDPLANTLAVIVLVTLIISWIISLALTLSSRPIPTAKSWYSRLLPVFALLGIPAAVDLLQTGGWAFALAVVVFMVLMLNIIIPLLMENERATQAMVKVWYRWAIPVLVICGLAVASYLTYIETTKSQPVCGPVGDCGTVQKSQYAFLFGVLPIGVLGLAGYLAILAAWFVQQFGPGALKKLSTLAIWGMCIFGVLFSAYLTYLEPFVIGATCMWCITSAVLMILLLWVATPAAQEALAIRDDEDSESRSLR